MAIWARHRDPVGHKFWGKAKINGEWKHFEFSVITERRLSRRVMYLCVKKTMRALKYGKELPYRHYYHAYDGFDELFLRTRWIEVEEVIPDYKRTAT